MDRDLIWIHSGSSDTISSGIGSLPVMQEPEQIAGNSAHPPNRIGAAPLVAEAAPEGSFLPDTLRAPGRNDPSGTWEKRSLRYQGETIPRHPGETIPGTFVLFPYHKFKKSQGTTLPVFFFEISG